MFMGKKYYGEFLCSPEKISTNILANRLNKLEEIGLITKTADKENRTKNLYHLTKKGIELMPMLFEMIIWGNKYNIKTKIPEEFMLRYNSDKELFLKELMGNLLKDIKS